MSEDQGINIRRDQTSRGRTGSGPGSLRSTRKMAGDEDAVRITIKVPLRAKMILTATAAQQRRTLSDICRDVLEPEVARLAAELGMPSD